MFDMVFMLLYYRNTCQTFFIITDYFITPNPIVMPFKSFNTS